MSFLRGSPRFRFQLSDTERGVYIRHEIRLHQHIHERTEDVFAKFLVYAQEYHPDLQLTHSEDAIFFSRSEFDGSLLAWISVGVPSPLHIRQALGKLKKDSSCHVYFRNTLDEHQFVHQLRGSKTNWVEKIRFYLLNMNEFKEWFDECDENGMPSRLEIELIRVDDILYCSFDDKNFSCPVQPIDIWSSFQKSLETIS
jgi:uncharacterized protein YaeQ